MTALTTQTDHAAGWFLVIGLGLIPLAWVALNLLSSEWAERREQRRQQEAEDLDRAEAWFAELRDRDINALARGIGMTDMALAEHTAEAFERLSSVAPVIPIQRKGGAS